MHRPPWRVASPELRATAARARVLGGHAAVGEGAADGGEGVEEALFGHGGHGGPIPGRGVSRRVRGAFLPILPPPPSVRERGTAADGRRCSIRQARRASAEPRPVKTDAMPIAAASDTLVRHLRARLEEADAPDGWTVGATTDQPGTAEMP